MKIGHRGVAGYAPENTIKSIKAAIEYGVDGIEFDVRKTADQELVLCHDPTLKRVAGIKRKVSSMTYKEISNVRTHHGEAIPTLTQALEAVGSKPVIIEVKEKGMIDELVDILDEFPEQAISITSFDHEEMELLLKRRPELPVFLNERSNPIEVVQTAVRIGAFGIGLNFWLLNPMTYILARRAGLQIFVYTVNKPFLGSFINRLYPDVQICTNFPDRIKMRSKTIGLGAEEPQIKH